MKGVVDLLGRPTYTMPQVDRLLGLCPGTARRWIDGYVRAGHTYDPVVRQRHTGEETATWGEAPLGALDDEWIPKVAARDPVVITRDKRIRAKHAKAMLYTENGLRVFGIAGKKDLSNWDTMCLLTRRWNAIERELKERGPGPWFMGINDTGLRDMQIFR